MKVTEPIKLFDIAKSYEVVQKEVDHALDRVLRSGVFILGEEVSHFEKEFARYVGVRYSVAVASGTDALILSLKALGLSAGDEVIVPVNSYPTAFAVAWAGFTPRFVDIEKETYNIDLKNLERSFSSKTRAIVSVHLYGNPCNIAGILSLSRKYRIPLIEDAAQAHGAYLHGRHVGTFTDFGAFSFYPTKNLGGFGDGGMVVTNNKKRADMIGKLRMYGELRRYESTAIGTNSRLDELQAAALRVKLKLLPKVVSKRRELASLYRTLLAKLPLFLPKETGGAKHAYHLFVIRTDKRDSLQSFLLQNGVQTAVHYKTPAHLVSSFSHLGYRRGDFPIAEELASQILSIPCHEHLTHSQVKRVCYLVKAFFHGVV